MPAGRTYTPIATTTVTSATNTVTFDSISSAYTDLSINISGFEQANGYVLIRYNNDSTALYSRTAVYGDGSNPQQFAQTGQTSHFVSMGGINTQPQNIEINNYSNTSTFKTTLLKENRTDSSIGITSGLYRSTSAISRIDFISSNSTSSIQPGTTITIYGIAAA